MPQIDFPSSDERSQFVVRDNRKRVAFALRVVRTGEIVGIRGDDRESQLGTDFQIERQDFESLLYFELLREVWFISERTDLERFLAFQTVFKAGVGHAVVVTD